ncbi:PLDc N-terminal domain-containing protein [Saccharothrix syringae]|uniref:Cardiolipin synthase N-terminal domain-containing protein n=1 Tax=Saccharothrix syringae TaxID=103733 RepID=A0A5Q0H089_SACSY|nr:PLDc N-terminal domain-containing protein [Saccharothrix syringae]QFZ19671.1 hypothetical protein EKG83_21550 [Saccharothrix syringae]
MTKKWSELSRSRQRAAVALATAQVGLAAAWTDLARRPASAVNGRKGLWALVIGVNFIGPPAWFLWGRR